jgi:hypothetical protein
MENSLTDIEADGLLEDAVRSVKKENRSHGRLRLMLGSGMLLVGAVIFSVVVLSLLLRWDSSLLPFRQFRVLLGFWGLALAVGGLFVFLSGFWSSTTGK